MPAGIKMELVRNFLLQQLLVQLLGPSRESVFILLPAIDVDRLIPKLYLVLSQQLERIVLVPVRHIYWIAEHRAQQS